MTAISRIPGNMSDKTHACGLKSLLPDVPRDTSQTIQSRQSSVAWLQPSFGVALVRQMSHVKVLHKLQHVYVSC